MIGIIPPAGLSVDALDALLADAFDDEIDTASSTEEQARQRGRRNEARPAGRRDIADGVVTKVRATAATLDNNALGGGEAVLDSPRDKWRRP